MWLVHLLYEELYKIDMRELEYGDGYTFIISLEILVLISEMPGFGEVSYSFVNIVC